MTAAGEGWLDVSLWPHIGMTYRPGDPLFLSEPAPDMKFGDITDVSTFFAGSRTGTCVYAPPHLVQKSKGLHQAPFTATIGRARVIEIHDPESVEPGDLRPHGLSRGERVLLKTPNSARSWPPDASAEGFVYLSRAAARYMATCGIQTVGLDYLFVGGPHKDAAGERRMLLRAGAWVIEGLNLSEVETGDYELICLPLKAELSDGAPARAILTAI